MNQRPNKVNILIILCINFFLVEIVVAELNDDDFLFCDNAELIQYKKSYNPSEWNSFLIHISPTYVSVIGSVFFDNTYKVSEHSGPLIRIAGGMKNGENITININRYNGEFYLGQKAENSSKMTYSLSAVCGHKTKLF